MAFKTVAVERKEVKRGRKKREMPGMEALVLSWDKVVLTEKGRPKNWVGVTLPLPDGPTFTGDESGKEIHSTMANFRHHFRKYAEVEGLKAGVDYTIEFNPETLSATITKLQ